MFRQTFKHHTARVMEYVQTIFQKLHVWASLKQFERFIYLFIFVIIYKYGGINLFYIIMSWKIYYIK